MTEPIYPMVIVGAATLGGAWFISAMVATAVEQDNETEWLYIPLAGPWVTLAARDYAGNDCASQYSYFTCTSARAEDTYAAVGLVLDGVIQAGALAVFIAGLAVERERLVPAYSVAPLSVPGGGGLQLIGSF